VLRRQGDSVIVPAAGLAGERVVAERSPLLGPGIKVRDLSASRSEAMSDAGGPERLENAAAEMIALTPERRAALRAAVEANARLPEAAKARILAQLDEETVPARTVERIESRMGG
jgi:hypothetical protein